MERGRSPSTEHPRSPLLSADACVASVLLPTRRGHSASGPVPSVQSQHKVREAACQWAEAASLCVTCGHFY